MGTKIAALAAAALWAGISGAVATPERAPEGMRILMAESAARAVGRDENTTCGRMRGFVRRFGEGRSIEIARLNHSDAEIEYWRRVCFPEAKPISRR